MMERRFWFVIVLFIPALILLLYYALIGLGSGSLVFLYLTTIMFIVLSFWLIIRKKLCSLFVLPIGLFIAPLFEPIWRVLLGMRYGGFMDTPGFSMIFLMIIYACPFAFITLIIITVMKDRDRRKQLKNEIYISYNNNYDDE